MVLCFTIANYLATLGQNRFGYYLVPATAVVIAWLAVRILDWGGVPHADNPHPKVRQKVPLQRELAVMAVAGRSRARARKLAIWALVTLSLGQ